MNQRVAVAVLGLAALLGACAGAPTEQAEVVVTPVGGGAKLPARLVEPKGPGPFPAVVMLHDCSGLGPRSSGAPARWASTLVEQGYAVLIPDSFTPRGFADGVCTRPFAEWRAVGFTTRAADAYGALAYLRARPEIDPGRIAVMGGSHGGGSVLAAMARPVGRGALAEAKRDGFVVAVALYPPCTLPLGTWRVTRQLGATGPVIGYAGTYEPTAPLLILIGEKDDWTPAEACRHLVAASRDAGYPVDLRVYPGAQHSFDSNFPVRYVAERSNGKAPGGKGATTGGDPLAWAAARRDALAFLAARLKSER
jgi:dienelactone hydrolase